MLCRKSLVQFLVLVAAIGVLIIESVLSSSGARELGLPQPRYESEISVEEALKNRRSIRSFKKSSLTIEEVSQLLWAAYGITDPAPKGPSFLRGGKRTAPSAGGLYPLELYLLAGNVSGLAPGIYKYDSQRHSLQEVSKGDKRSELSKAALGQEMFQVAPVSVLYTAVFERTTRKYGSRGRQRYVWMDSGHSAQNLYLQAYALKLVMCVSGAFSDSKIRGVFGISAEEEPVYLVVIGHKKGQ
jgi:SagB-type dehydrogenase family enzyme